MNALNCPNCGAAMPAYSAKAEVVSCDFCGTSFRLSNTFTPEPDMGDLLLGADFGNRIMPGWEVVNEDKLTFHKGSPSELRGRFAPQVNSYYALKSSGLLDNFDASVSIKFTEGDKEWIRAGFYTRFTPAGGYGFMVSAQASYVFGSFVKDEKGELVFQKMMAWAYHSALKPGLNINNRLRVMCNGDSFRVYLNGVLAGSFKDSKFALGKLHLAVEPSAKSTMEIAFSDLQLREVPK